MFVSRNVGPVRDAGLDALYLRRIESGHGVEPGARRQVLNQIRRSPRVADRLDTGQVTGRRTDVDFKTSQICQGCAIVVFGRCGP